MKTRRLRAAVADVVHDDGTDLVRAAEVAAAADVAIVVVGYTYLDEGEFIGDIPEVFSSLFPATDEPEVVERFQAMAARLPTTTKPQHLVERPRGFSLGGDRTSLRLPDADVALVQAVAAANPRTVVAIQAGSAVVATEWCAAVPAVVQAWYGGSQAGPGLADVLLGEVNPSARLPFSVPVDEADLPAFDKDATSFSYDRWHGWWHLGRSGTDAAFPFGFGLSYTSFALAAADATPADGVVTVRATVDNTGQRDGADVVQVYAELPDPEAPPRLVGFARVEVPAGGSAEGVVEVPVDRLATRDPEQHTWRPAHGGHRFVVARHAGDPGAVVIDLDL